MIKLPVAMQDLMEWRLVEDARLGAFHQGST